MVAEEKSGKESYAEQSLTQVEWATPMRHCFPSLRQVFWCIFFAPLLS